MAGQLYYVPLGRRLVLYLHHVTSGGCSFWTLWAMTQWLSLAKLSEYKDDDEDDDDVCFDAAADVVQYSTNKVLHSTMRRTRSL